MPIDICTVSPSDMAGQINNIMERLLNCEIAIAKLAGLDVTASNASDMVASLGTITNGTIISPTTTLSASIADWAGTVLPANFSGSVTSNGVTTTWNNGVVTFTVDNTGITVGGGGGGDFASVFTTSSDTITNGTNQHQMTIDDTDYNTGIGSLASDVFTLSAGGEYLVTAMVSISADAYPWGSGVLGVHIANGSLGTASSYRESVVINSSLPEDLAFSVTGYFAGVTSAKFGVMVDNNSGQSVTASVTSLLIQKLV